MYIFMTARLKVPGPMAVYNHISDQSLLSTLFLNSFLVRTNPLVDLIDRPMSSRLIKSSILLSICCCIIFILLINSILLFHSSSTSVMCVVVYVIIRVVVLKTIKIDRDLNRPPYLTWKVFMEDGRVECG
ncbi:hypothetical protein AKO1_003856, partial [Acrasis kona]